MTRIRFVEHNGTVHDVEADNGTTVMRAAIEKGIPGIQAECGGNLSCSTCHGFIEQKFFDLMGPPSENEQVLLECTLDPQPNSRLTCQINITPELEGMTVTWPESQY